MSGTNTIEIRNLCKTYGDLVIFDHLNLTLAPDTVYCLTGASGIGKTTLLHMLLGLEAWDSGEILGLDGLRTAAVFQEDRLCLSFSPLENIRMAVGRAVSREEILKEAKHGANGRYACINLTNTDTIEFRVFRGTLKYNTVIATLQFVANLCRVAISLPEYRIQEFSWPALIEALTQDNCPELVQYLKERNLYVNEPVTAEREV